MAKLKNSDVDWYALSLSYYAKEMYELLKRYHEESRFVYGEDYDEVEELLEKVCEFKFTIDKRG